MAQQNVYEIGGSTDAIVFYSSTQYGPPVGVDLNTGQQQMGNQIASQNVQNTEELYKIIQESSERAKKRISEFSKNWSNEIQKIAGSIGENLKSQNDKIAKNLGPVIKEIGSEVINVTVNPTGEQPLKAKNGLPIPFIFDDFSNNIRRDYERVTTGYESQLIDQWQNPTLEPGWKSSDPYDPNVYKQLPKYRVSGASTSGTLYTGR